MDILRRQHAKHANASLVEDIMPQNRTPYGGVLINSHQLLVYGSYSVSFVFEHILHYVQNACTQAAPFLAS